MLRNFFILLSMLFLSNFVYAKDDKQHTMLSDIIINSDNLILDKETSTSVFSGHVILWFNNGLIIETDKLVLRLKEESGIRTLSSILLPHKLRSIKDGSSAAKTINSDKMQHSEITIVADSAEYIHDKSSLTLKGNVHMQENSNFIKCDELTYLANIEKLSTNGK